METPIQACGRIAQAIHQAVLDGDTPSLTRLSVEEQAAKAALVAEQAAVPAPILPAEEPVKVAAPVVPEVPAVDPIVTEATPAA
jgi:hypothetical protein